MQEQALRSSLCWALWGGPAVFVPRASEGATPCVALIPEGWLRGRRWAGGVVRAMDAVGRTHCARMDVAAFAHLRARLLGADEWVSSAEPAALSFVVDCLRALRGGPVAAVAPAA